MPDRTEDTQKLETLLETALEIADTLKLGLVGVKISEALDHIRRASSNGTDTPA
jgi:hypothetical protein